MQNTSQITIFGAILKKGSDATSCNVLMRADASHCDRAIGAWC